MITTDKSRPLEDLKFWNGLRRRQQEQQNKSFALIGIDEVGRGPLFGPVVASAVGIVWQQTTAVHGEFGKILAHWQDLGVGDSKKLKSERRKKILNELFSPQSWLQGRPKDLVIGPLLVSAELGLSSTQEIDSLNILQASLLAMRRAHQNLQRRWKKSKLELTMGQQQLLVDGNQNPYRTDADWKDRATCLVKGDRRSLLIGLASLLAKEYRDYLIGQMAEQFPGYGLERHAGYPTPTHLKALKELGPTTEHRHSYRPVREALQGRSA